MPLPQISFSDLGDVGITTTRILTTRGRESLPPRRCQQQLYDHGIHTMQALILAPKA
jgi:hypothetical protein